MKKVFFILVVILIGGACENFEDDFPDYDYTSGFFPYQTPVRTLVLGDYIYDNSNDNAHKFVISVAMGGVYENTRDRKFTIEVDENLCNNILFGRGLNQIKPMPRNWYTLKSDTEIVIPSGKFSGGVEVQLKEEFFQDPTTIGLSYVIPIRLKSSSDVDTILRGKPIIANPDERLTGDWIAAPKDFTMFAVKYINEYHGNYFRYGTAKLTSGGATIRDSLYNQEKYVEKYPVHLLTTTARKQVSINATFATREGKTADPMTGGYQLLLNFDANNSCTVSAPTGSPYTITGTGEFKTNAYTWGNKERNGIVLNYTISDGTNIYTAGDVLVARDRAVVMEVYKPAAP